MSISNVHPLGRIYAVQAALENMSREQLALGGILGEAIEAWDNPAMSSAVETVCMHAIVMAGMAKRLAEIRRELSPIVP
jgi:hypothetical protein